MGYGRPGGRSQVKVNAEKRARRQQGNTQFSHPGAMGDTADCTGQAELSEAQVEVETEKRGDQGNIVKS